MSRHGLLYDTITVLHWLDRLHQPYPQPKEILDLAFQVRAAVVRSEIKVEAQIQIFAVLSDLLEFHEVIEKAAELRLLAARLLLSTQALSAAWRALDEAERLAVDCGATEIYAQVLSVKTMLLIDNNEFSEALQIGLRALDLYEDVGAETPAGLLSNLALCYLRAGDYDEAASKYEALIRSVSGDPDWADAIFGMYMNLAVCYRELDRMPEAQIALDQAWRGAAAAGATPEQLLELSLISAKSAHASGQLDQAIEYLVDGLDFLDDLLEGVTRPHYRRWIRRQYVKRLEENFGRGPGTGSAENALAVFARSRAGTLSDWMVLLDWQSTTAATIGSSPLLVKLNGLIQKLTDEGSPFNHGMREKYDDAFSRLANRAPWDEFDALVIEIISEFPHLTHPFKGIGSQQFDVLRSAARGRLLFFAVRGPETYLVLIWGDRYFRIELSDVFTEEYATARIEYEIDQYQKFGNFARQLETLVHSVSERIIPCLANLDLSALEEIIIFPDALDHIPVLAVLLKIESIRDAMTAGELCVTTCPVIAVGTGHPQNGGRLVSVFDPELDLAHAEQVAVSDAPIFDCRTCATTTLFTSSDEEAVLEANAVHVAAHGLPISLYTEPWSSSLWSSGGTGLSFGWVQLYAARANASLYLLNMCHSADKSTRNSYETFLAGDGADYPSLLLLNRKSTILACAWRTLDTVSFVLTSAFIDELVESNDNPANVYSRVLARLRANPIPIVKKMLARIPEARIREKKLQNMDDERTLQMFQSSYALGAHRCYRLLPNPDGLAAS